MRVAVIGQGYVGLTISIGASNAGHKVVGIDKNDCLVAKLNSGKSHIEGISDDSLIGGIKSGLYQATSDFSRAADAEIVVIAVPTPLDQKNQPDVSILVSAVDSITPFLREGALVINESTSYVGTLRNLIAAPVSRARPGVSDFAISPERVDPGNLIFGLKNTPRLVGGVNPSSEQRAFDFYSTFCDKVIKVSSPEVAEAAKLLENSFRFINIGFINEFSQIVNALGISTTEVIAAASTKPYGFMPFFPNVGIGGHCIPVDPLYLQKNAEDLGIPSKYIEVSELTNREMPSYSINLLERKFGRLDGKRVLVVGVTYKPNISDTRESPAEHIIKILRKRGARVNWHDPLVNEYLGENSSSVSEEFDLALVLVKHDRLDMSSWRGGPIYCVRKSDSNQGWIPILDAEIKQ
jgi:UDP-N-acetyl-D-glucosamine dehydrogenase